MNSNRRLFVSVMVIAFMGVGLLQPLLAQVPKTFRIGSIGSPNPTISIVPLFDESTELEPPTTIHTDEALITRVGDRVRDRHAREDKFQAYDHYLPFYWEERTVAIEIIDRVAKGGNDITINTTSIIPLGTRDFRAFFRGLNTPAEYFHNVGMTQVVPGSYTTTINFNAKEGRGILIGDRMEFEFSPFLQNPMNGRTNYYGTAFLYIVGTGIVPWEAVGTIQDSFPMPESAKMGGMTTLSYQYSNEPDNLFKQMATNLAPINAQPFVLGRRLHHTDFESGAHSEPNNPSFFAQAGKLGPKYIAESCVACHKNNGRSFPPGEGQTLLQTVVRIGTSAQGRPHPIWGSVLQPQSTNGTDEPSASIASYDYIDGHYEDGSKYQLRKPNYAFAGGMPSHFSVRMAPPLVGAGLIEAIDESDITAWADPDDDDNDGISGRISTVIDPETSDLRLGRFNHKAAQARLRHQVASALSTDMGVSTTVFRQQERGIETQQGLQLTLPQAELNDVELDYLTRYVAVLGVHARRDTTDTNILNGEQLFGSIGCADCHRTTFTTSSYHPMTELREQTIHPYSDFLLHDMGPGLADNMGEGDAAGNEWRTTPLWSIGHTAGVGGQEAYLHDGRARNLAEAILWHGGEAANAQEAFRNLSESDRSDLIAFLKSL